MTLPKKLTEKRNALAENFKDNNRNLVWWQPTLIIKESFIKGFEAGALEVMKEAEKLVEALIEANEGTSSALEDMQHYFENKCCPTADEVNQIAINDSNIRLAIGKWKKWKGNE